MPHNPISPFVRLVHEEATIRAISPKASVTMAVENVTILRQGMMSKTPTMPERRPPRKIQTGSGRDKFMAVKADVYAPMPT